MSMDSHRLMVDVFGKNLVSIADKRLFLLDMDGTIYTGDVLYEGVSELLAEIHGVRGEYVFLTNNSSRSVDAYIRRINEMGIQANRENFCTSLDAVAAHLQSEHSESLIYCVGTESLKEGLRAMGLHVVDDVSLQVDVVLLGFDTELSFAKIAHACELLSNHEVAYYATNMDLACPVPFGFVPDCGAMANMLREATGRTPVFFGKPAPFMVLETMKRLGYTRDETVVIGDRLYTDIACGVNAGVDTVCVLTGEATIAEIEESPIHPTFVIETVSDLLKVVCDL